MTGEDPEAWSRALTEAALAAGGETAAGETVRAAVAAMAAAATPEDQLALARATFAAALAELRAADPKP